MTTGSAVIPAGASKPAELCAFTCSSATAATLSLRSEPSPAARAAGYDADMLPRAAVLALVTLGLAGCNLQQDIGGRADHSAPNSSAPALAGRTTDGGYLPASATAGRVLAIDFWGSWCGPCRAEQPDLNTLAASYSPRGVLFVGVDMRDDLASAEAYRRDFKVPYQSIFDEDGSVAAAFNVTAPPTFIIVDRSGHISSRLLGTLTGSKEALDGALG